MGKWEKSIVKRTTVTIALIFTFVSASFGLGVDIVATHVGCYGGNDGTALAIIADDTALVYTYVWSNGQTTPAIQNLTAGYYAVTVTSSAGKIATDMVQITQPPLLHLTVSVTDAGCLPTSGSATALALGGVEPYYYTWSNGSTGSQVSQMDTGSYTVTVSDANNCTAQAAAVVGAPTLPQATFLVTQPSCSGDADGTIIVSVSQGSEPYTYIWSTGDTGNTLDNLGDGTYRVIITDSQQCSFDDSITLTAPLPVSVEVTSSSSGSGESIVSAAATGGNDTNYTYLWNNGSRQSSIDNAQEGWYHVWVEDTKGCRGFTRYYLPYAEPTGMATDEGMIDFQVFPSPAENLVFVKIASGNGPTHELTIYNALGEEVYFGKNITERTIDVQNWANGAYLIILRTPSAVVTRRFMVNR